MWTRGAQGWSSLLPPGSVSSKLESRPRDRIQTRVLKSVGRYVDHWAKLQPMFLVLLTIVSSIPSTVPETQQKLIWEIRFVFRIARVEFLLPAPIKSCYIQKSKDCNRVLVNMPFENLFVLNFQLSKLFPFSLMSISWLESWVFLGFFFFIFNPKALT